MGQVIQKGILGEAIRDFAAARDISISSLEKNAGYSPGMVSRWIAAGTEDYSSLSKLVTLADLLNVSLDDLVSRKREALPKDGPSDPVSRLEAETLAGQLVWWGWQPDNGLSPAGPIPNHKSDRLCCGGWQTQRDNLDFLLVLFCDDIDDDDEPMEIELYCTPGHKLPLFPVPDTSPAALSNLYTQILLSDAFAAHREHASSTVLPFCAPDNKATASFRCLNN